MRWSDANQPAEGPISADLQGDSASLLPSSGIDGIPLFVSENAFLGGIWRREFERRLVELASRTPSTARHCDSLRSYAQGLEIVGDLHDHYRLFDGALEFSRTTPRAAGLVIEAGNKIFSGGVGDAATLYQQFGNLLLETSACRSSASQQLFERAEQTLKQGAYFDVLGYSYFGLLFRRTERNNAGTRQLLECFYQGLFRLCYPDAVLPPEVVTVFWHIVERIPGLVLEDFGYCRSPLALRTQFYDRRSFVGENKVYADFDESDWMALAENAVHIR